MLQGKKNIISMSCISFYKNIEVDMQNATQYQ